jgi:hypothetical protein
MLPGPIIRPPCFRVRVLSVAAHPRMDYPAPSPRPYTDLSSKSRDAGHPTPTPGPRLRPRGPPRPRRRARRRRRGRRRGRRCGSRHAAGSAPAAALSHGMVPSRLDSDGPARPVLRPGRSAAREALPTPGRSRARLRRTPAPAPETCPESGPGPGPGTSHANARPASGPRRPDRRAVSLRVAPSRRVIAAPRTWARAVGRVPLARAVVRANPSRCSARFRWKQPLPR